MRKKVVPSREALNQQALDKGAKVTATDGTAFNAGKAQKKKRLPAKKKAAPAPPPPAPDKGAELIATELASGNQAMAMMLNEIKKQIADIRIQTAEPITEWVVDIVERDDRGFSKRIKISAPKPRLNS